MIAPLPQAQAPLPIPGESQPDYAVRAHAALLEAVPLTSERNRLVLEAWRAYGNDPLIEKARQTFPDDSWSHKTDIPQFAEHTKERLRRDSAGNPLLDDKGQPVREVDRYDLPALVAICNRCNDRIADTGNFAALSEGHTPTQDQVDAGHKHPELLGYSGPFFIGQVGDKSPRWAIFSDEHYWHDTAPKVARLPTRSVEVWLSPRMEDRFFDPIAALGTETPKLDIGVRFARLHSGELVERYSATFAGAGNVAAPGLVQIPKRTERYSTDPEEGTFMLQPEEIQQVVEALMQTKPFQWLQSQMESSEMAASQDPVVQTPETDGGDGMPPGAPPPAEPAAPPAVPAEDPNKDPNGMGRYSRGNGDLQERYARLERSYEDLQRQVHGEVTARRNAERYSKIQSLSRERVLDVKEEVDRCSKMSDTDFQTHCAMILKRYEKIPVGCQLPDGHIPRPATEVAKDQYSKKLNERALEIANAALAKGEHLPYASALDSARKDLGPAPGE